MGVHVSPARALLQPPPPPIPQGHPSAPALSALFHAPNLEWSSYAYEILSPFS